MLVTPVARIDDRAGYGVGNKCRTARDGSPYDNGVDAHGLDVAGRVDEGLTLRCTRAAGSEVDHGCAQPLRRNLEAHAGSSGILEEDVGNDPPAQPLLRHGLPDGCRKQALGVIDQRAEFGDGKALDGEEVARGA